MIKIGINGFGRIGRFVFRSTVEAENAKAKPVEAYFGYLNKNYCQRCNNWSGFGITTDPKKQPTG